MTCLVKCGTFFDSLCSESVLISTACPTSNGHGSLARNYVCGATGGDYLIVYVQDCCIGRNNSSSCTTALYELHRDVERDLQVTQGLVFTPADHFPHSLHVSCPFALHELLDLTFLNVAIFRQCTVGMSSILASLKSRFQSVPKWSRRYSWGCRWSASLPVARILPKPSKGFAKARPIIACDQCWHTRLTAFLAKGVFQIMLVVFPPGLTFNILSVLQTIRTIWHSMMSYPATEPTSMVQQDLIGFFNSVPHNRILQTLPWQEQSLQLCSRNKDPSFRVFRGRRRFAARNTRTMHLEDLPALTDFMLQSSFF